MKKATALLLCFLLLLSLFVGCKTKPGKTPAPSGSAATEETPPDTTEEQEEEYFLDPEPGNNQLTFYWDGGGRTNFENCDMWIWYPNADGRGYLFHPCAYGGKVVLNVPEGVEEVGFIVRTDCSDPGGTGWGEANKDFGDDRYAVIEGPETVIYLKSGDGAQYKSNDGGFTLEQTKTFELAGIIAANQIRYTVHPAVLISSLDQVKVYEGDREIAIAELSSLNNKVITGVITTAEDLDISKNYTVEIKGYEPHPAIPTGIFDSQEFIDKYTYDGDDLGAVIHGDKTVFKVWAPTASKVVLNLFEAGNGGSAYETVEMQRGDRGVWSVEADCGHGTYYTYSVTTSLGTQEAVDPYARTVGVNGDRGMVVDLSKTDPEGFSQDKYYSGLSSYSDAVIWEVHVRDFSNTIEGTQYPGKYLAFTETGLKNSAGQSVGMDYLKELGVTHVHLQPVYDYATVDESKDTPQFNWGYDPKNYNAPEGSYSTDPYHGEVRVNEFKQMVKALHDNGMAVVMDVVYNHTYSIDSCFDRIVPYYYYRYNAKGTPSNGSGCGNETASDRVMFRKYMVDSVAYWAKEYHVDGFRFDLMGLHDIETMQEVEKAVHKINPKAIIYGEGWTGGTTPLLTDLQAKKENIHQVEATGSAIGSVAVFNDEIRDGLKGSVFTVTETAYINNGANTGNARRVIFGITGGERNDAVSWGVENDMVINYMGCHDNNTLWDKLAISNPDDSEEARFEMNRLGISILMISKGTPFFLAGEEMLRTKQGDANSYNSSDEINNLDWECLQPGSLQLRMHDYYRDLIAMRKANDFLRTGDRTCTVLGENVIQVKYTQGGKVIAVAVINPNDAPVSYTLPDGSWGVLINGEAVSAAPSETVSGGVEVPAKGVLLVKAP